MSLTVAKWALPTFIDIGVTILVIASVRGARKVKTQRRRSNPDWGPSTTWAVVPPTPCLSGPIGTTRNLGAMPDRTNREGTADRATNSRPRPR